MSHPRGSSWTSARPAQEVLLAAKVHPVAGMDTDELAEAMDEIDSRLRSALPEIGEVFIDVTAHSSRDGPEAAGPPA
jgi:hypothetical protein